MHSKYLLKSVFTLVGSCKVERKHQTYGYLFSIKNILKYLPNGSKIAVLYLIMLYLYLTL
jgi:hypothetical protein